MQPLVSRATAGLRNWRFWLGLGISVVSIVLVSQGVNLQELTSALRDIGLVWLLPAAFSLIGALAVRAVRWRILFLPQQGLRFTTLFHVINISFLVNNIVPARAGDLLRAGLISNREPVNTSRALATVVVERVLDGITVVLILTVVLPLFPVPDGVVRIGRVAGLAFVAVGVGLVILSTQRARSVRWANTILRRVPRVDEGRWSEGVGGLVDGLQMLRSPAAVGQAAVWSALVWLLSGVAYYFVLQAFDLQLSVAAAMFVLAVTTLVLVVPSTPGYIGVFDYAAVLALSIFGVERSLALSCAVVLHAVSFITFSVMGLISLLRESLSLSTVLGRESPAISEQ